jgi:hypothetical protein
MLKNLDMKKRNQTYCSQGEGLFLSDNFKELLYQEEAQYLDTDGTY